MMVEQICIKCGKIFLRSKFHPQVTVCPDCKDNTNGTYCLYCADSYKQEWELFCRRNQQVVTSCLSCEHFVSDHFSEIEKKEITETIEMIGGKRWI